MSALIRKVHGRFGMATMKLWVALMCLATSIAAAASTGVAGLTNPGASDYPDAGMRVLGRWPGKPAQSYPDRVAIDSVHGYAYIATARYRKAQLLKLALGAGTELPRVVADVPMKPANPFYVPEGMPEYRLALDPARACGLFASTGSTQITKFMLGDGDAPPRAVGTISYSEWIRCLAIDPATGYGYVGAGRKLLKVDLGTGEDAPRIVSWSAENLEEDAYAAVAIDSAAGYAYVGLVPYRNQEVRYGVVKLALGAGELPPTRVGVLWLTPALPTPAPGQEARIAIDPAAGVGYVTSGVNASFRLGAGAELPTLLSTFPGDGRISCVVDPATSSVYVAGVSNLRKAPVSNSTEPPAFVWDQGFFQVCDFGIDPVRGYGYVLSDVNQPYGQSGYPGWVEKFALNGTGVPTSVGIRILDRGIGEIAGAGAVLDVARRRGYMISDLGQVMTVAVPTDTTSGTMTGVFRLDDDSTDPFLITGVRGADVDTSSGTVFLVGTNSVNTTPYTIHKVVPDAGGLPSRVESRLELPNSRKYVSHLLALPGGESILTFNSATPALVGQEISVNKIAMKNGETPRIVGSVTLGDRGGEQRSALLDAGRGHACFVLDSTVFKVAINSPEEAPTIVATYVSTEGAPSAGVIDPEGGYVLYWCATAHGRSTLLKLDITAGSALPKLGAWEVTHAPFNASPKGLAAINPAGGYACFNVVDYDPTILFRVNLGNDAEPPSLAGQIDYKLDPTTWSEQASGGIFIDPASDLAWFQSRQPRRPASIVRVAMGRHRGLMMGTKITLREPASSVTAMRFFSHTAAGNLRFALYDNAEPKNLLWQSDVVPNTAAGAEVVVPIPAGLALPVGTYWATWQTDSTATVASYTAGAIGDGLYVAHGFGEAPALLGAEQVYPTAERWTQSFIYTTENAITGYMVY